MPQMSEGGEEVFFDIPDNDLRVKITGRDALCELRQFEVHIYPYFLFFLAIAFVRIVRIASKVPIRAQTFMEAMLLQWVVQLVGTMQ